MKLAKRRNESTIDMLRREMDQIFDDLVPFSWHRENDDRISATWAPSADISENEKEYRIHLDIPGMEKEDIKVNVQDGRITVTGDRKVEEEQKNGDAIRRERYYGSFYRSFSLPEKVLEENIQAQFKNGVLRLTVPKAEVVTPKSIKVV